MAGPRADKVAVVEEVKNRLERADAAILTEYRGLNVTALATLRRSLRGAGAEYKIYKNTLVRRATAEAGTTVIDPMLDGPTAIAFVDTDVAAVAKVLRDFARTNPALVVKGSLVGEELYDARTTAALADLPSREVLLAQIAGALAAPMRQLAGLLQALPRNMAYGISALIDQKRAAGDTSGEVAAEANVGTDAQAGDVAAEANAATDAQAEEEVSSPKRADSSSEASATETEASATEAAPEAQAEAETAPDAEPETE